LFFGKDHADAIKMNNQQRLEIDESIDEEMDQEAASTYEYYPESSQKIF
jgi:hypothetical protein